MHKLGDTGDGTEKMTCVSRQLKGCRSALNKGKLGFCVYAGIDTCLNQFIRQQKSAMPLMMLNENVQVGSEPIVLQGQYRIHLLERSALLLSWSRAVLG
jgi:hypothetical protein